MLKTLLVPFVLPLLLLFGNSSDKSAARLKQINNGSDNSEARVKQNSPESSETGTLEKMIVADGSAAMDVDLNRLNGIGSPTRIKSLRFTVSPDSFFTILVFNKVLRGPEPGSMALIPQSSASLPAALNASFNQLVIEKAGWTEPFDLLVRDGKTGFIFFNIEGNLYDYDANAQVLSINQGRLLVSEEFAAQLGRPAEAGSVVGNISITATMRAIEITHVVNGESTSAELPPNGTGVPGPDVIVGSLPSLQQFGSSGTQVGLAVATDSCNAGAEPLNWFALPNNDHPVIPQNLYRMSGGATNDERFEQVGQSSVKHAFTALQQDICGFGCQSSGTGTRLGAGCSDPYSASLNSGGSGNSLGSRAWINPFTGVYPRGDSSTPPNSHSGHSHTGTSHRILVNSSDLNTTLNPGATYYAEAQYVTPHEYAWCQSNPGQCNMYNNSSYRRFNVSGTTSFTFSGVGSTVQTKPAIVAWLGATHSSFEPVPGVDGVAYVSYKVTNPSPGVWHYEYAVYNENLDRGIQSFSVPLAPGITISNIGFHAPPQHPGSANDGTVGSAGYSSTPWSVTQTSNSITWNSETFAQNQNANAIRWGTMYNFRFDSDQPPQTTNSTIGFFKTGTPVSVQIQGPAGAGPTPTPTPTPGTGTASFVTTDTTTQGNWNDTYGADGYNIIGDTVNYPAYAQVNPSNNLFWTWEASTTDVRALRKASLADRIAATWYSATSFTINLNLTDAQTHRVALYCVDFDSQGRSQTIEIRDGASNTLLDSRSLTAFTGGRYLVWDITGNVNIIVTRNAGPNAVVSGLFFGPGAAPTPTPTATPTPTPGAGGASFVTTDTTTQGNWNGTYGADGYNIIGDTVNYPAYAQVNPSNNLFWTWEASTTDVRALRKASLADRIAATWYSATSFTINLNLTDAQTHRVALYCVDFDSQGRSQTIEIRDGASNTLLDSRGLTAFTGGRYLVWDITGNVNIILTRNAGPNAVVSGLFFGPGAAPTPTPTATPTPTPGAGGASFVTTDTTTQGNWNGTYGADGYNIIGDTVNYPAYAQVNPSNNLFWTWAASTSDVRALRKASLVDRIAATWYSPTSFTINLNLTDGQTHRIGLYCVDFDSQGRSQTVEIRDGTSNTLLDSRSLTAFTGGRYLVWDITGNVNIVVIRNAGPNAVVSGLFFGPPSPLTFNAVSVAGPISNPTAMAFAPDGRLFVCQQTGQLRVIEGGVLLPDSFVNLTVNFSGERGLLGVAFDPDFANNQWVYVYYTSPTAPIHNRVTRFTAAGNVAVVGSELPILELDNLSSATNHNGGAIHFGPDDKLYIAVGENANPANSQSLANLLGKMLRINSDGTIPSNNPTTFPGIAGSPSGNNRAIWSVGLRNPYTFDFQPGVGRMFINDVGQTTWEEINDGVVGSNYGWSFCEGACNPPNANFRDPLFQYGHGISPTTGCAITGGAFYNPTIVTYPSDYVGKYFYAEFCSGWIRRFDPATSTSQPFASGLSSPVDLKVGPDGNLYYLVRGGGGGVFKIIYS